MNAQNAESRDALTPADALTLLKEGNQRYVASKPAERDLREQRRQTEAGQWPYAVVLSCVDSRVSAELVFDQGIGDIFSVRIAGNFLNEDILGSSEFGCQVAGAKAIVVLGHTRCGAIKGACDGVELGHLTGLLKKLQPAVESVPEPTDDSLRNSSNADFVEAVCRANVEQTVAAIPDRSPVLRALIDSGEIAVAGAIYDITTGQVEWLNA